MPISAIGTYMYTSGPFIVHPVHWGKVTGCVLPLQAHILEYGLAVHEKFVPQDMRPLHKKLVDQFHMMRSSLGLQVGPSVHLRGMWKRSLAFLVVISQCCVCFPLAPLCQ